MEKKLVFDMKSSKLILAIGQCSKCVKCAQAILARFCHEFFTAIFVLHDLCDLRAIPLEWF